MHWPYIANVYLIGGVLGRGCSYHRDGYRWWGWRVELQKLPTILGGLLSLAVQFTREARPLPRLLPALNSSAACAASLHAADGLPGRGLGDRRASSTWLRLRVGGQPLWWHADAHALESASIPTGRVWSWVSFLSLPWVNRLWLYATHFHIYMKATSSNAAILLKF